jgi:hypothetical protein
MRSRHLLRRRLSALLLGVFALAWGLDAHHRAWVPHVVCAVDGEVAHGSHAGHAHEHDGENGDDRDADDPRVAAPAEGEEHHEHCGLPDLGRSSTLDLPDAPRAGPPAPTALRDHVTPWAAAHEVVPRVSLAPKQSPPRAA